MRGTGDENILFFFRVTGQQYEQSGCTYCLYVGVPKVPRNFPRLCGTRESTRLTLETEKTIKIAANTALAIVTRDVFDDFPTNRIGPGTFIARCESDKNASGMY